MIAATYKYPSNDVYSETMATLPDGRVVTVDVQYAAVLPHGGHIPTVKPADAGPWAAGVGCPQLTKMGGRCTCAANADIMAQAAELVIEAREHGKFGRPERVRLEAEPEPIEHHGVGWCDRCESYCYGDCTASQS